MSLSMGLLLHHSQDIPKLNYSLGVIAVHE